MWKRTIAAGTIITGLLAITGGAIAAVGSDSSSTTSTTPPSTAPTTATSTAPSMTTEATLPGGDTSTVFEAGEAGTVTILRQGDVLTVDAVDAEAGWVPEIEVATGREVEVKFLSGAHRIDFNAELEDGKVRVRVRTRAVDDKSTTASTSTTLVDDFAQADLGLKVIDLGAAGSITVEVTEDGLALVSVDASQDWTETEIEVSSFEIEVELRNADMEVKAEVELDDGRLEIEVSMESEDDEDDSNEDSNEEDSDEEGSDDDSDDDSDEDEDDN